MNEFNVLVFGLELFFSSNSNCNLLLHFNSLVVPGRSEVLRPSPGFRLLGTVTTDTQVFTLSIEKAPASHTYSLHY